MTIYTGATTGNVVASYDTPDDGDDITAASVNVGLHGLTDDVGRLNARAILSDRNNLRRYAFTPFQPAGIVLSTFVDNSGGVTNFTTAAWSGTELYQWTLFNGTGGNTRTFSARFDAAYEGLVRRLSIRAHASNSGFFYIRNGLSSAGNEDVVAITPSTTLHVWADFRWEAESGGTVPVLIACSAGVAPGPSAYGTV